MRGLISHLRYTIRQLLKSPAFTMTAVLILGLGIGANTAIFSLVNGVLLKPLRYPNADRLFHLYRPFKNDNTAGFDYPDFAGLIGALLLSNLIEGMLFGVSPADPISFGASVLVLVSAALAACLLRRCERRGLIRFERFANDK